MRNFLISFLKYFLFFSSLSLLFILYLHYNNKNLIKIEKIVSFEEINQSNILEYFNLVDVNLFSKMNLSFQKNPSDIGFISNFIENSDSLFYNIFDTYSDTQRFKILNDEFTKLAQDYLWEYMREIQTDTDIVFENVISKSNIDTYLNKFSMKIDIYGFNEEDIVLRLDKIINSSNQSLLLKLKTETLETINKVIRRLYLLEQYHEYDESNLNEFIGQAYNMQKSIGNTIPDWYNEVLIESFQKRKTIERSITDLIDLKMRVEVFFENNLNKNFYIKLDKKDYNSLEKARFNISIYINFLIALSLILTCVVLFFQYKIKKDNLLD